MTTYEVTFRFETSTIVEVEADDPMHAQLVAQAEMNAMSVDHLPEMWPSDFMLESVEAVDEHTHTWEASPQPDGWHCSTCGQVMAGGSMSK